MYFDYPQIMQDAMRISLPKTFRAKLERPNKEAYTLSVTSDASGFTVRRNHIQTEILVMTKDYDGLRKFYAQLRARTRRALCSRVAPVTGRLNRARLRGITRFRA